MTNNGAVSQSGKSKGGAWGLEEIDLFLLRRPGQRTRKYESPSEVFQDRI